MADNDTSKKSKRKSKSGDDVVVLGGDLPDGAGRAVLRLREGRVEAGAVRPLEEGKPIAGEVVRLTPRETCPQICDVEVALPAKQLPNSTSGRPAQVASERYRKNWDAIYGRKKRTVLN